MFYILFALLTGFLSTFFLTRMAMDFLSGSGIVGKDQQKKDTPVIPTSGGVPVLFGYLTAISVFVGMRTFLSTPVDVTSIFASLLSVLVIGLIGLVDDIHVKENAEMVKKEEQISVGFRSWWIKPLLVLPAALPLMVVKAGHSMMVLPFLGGVDFGIFYPLVLVPVGVVCVSNATNMLAGQNGLEAGMGMIALASIGVFALANGSVNGAVIALTMASCLLAFLLYNFYPSQILPGDSLTYSIGAVIAASTIISNVEKFSLVIFTPWILEAFLKLRSRFQASSLGELQEDGTLNPKHDSVYSLGHLLMRMDGMTERRLVLSMWGVETIICITAFIIFL